MVSWIPSQPEAFWGKADRPGSQVKKELIVIYTHRASAVKLKVSGWVGGVQTTVTDGTGWLKAALGPLHTNYGCRSREAMGYIIKWI